MPLTSANKVIVLQVIKDNRNDLFGEFSSTLTKEKRVSCWKNVIATCKEDFGFDPCPGKDYTYLRDVMWPNLKRRTLEKVDSLRKTGAAGGIIDKQLNSQQELVLDILERKSGMVSGLDVPETYEKTADASADAREADSVTATLTDGTAAGPSNSVTRVKAAAGSRQRHSVERKCAAISSDEAETLKRRKLELQVHELELRNEHWQLQNAKLRIEISNMAGANDIQFCTL